MKNSFWTKIPKNEHCGQMEKNVKKKNHEILTGSKEIFYIF